MGERSTYLLKENLLTKLQSYIRMLLEGKQPPIQGNFPFCMINRGENSLSPPSIANMSCGYGWKNKDTWQYIKRIQFKIQVFERFHL